MGGVPVTKVENMVENICVLGSGTKNMTLRTYCVLKEIKNTLFFACVPGVS